LFRRPALVGWFAIAACAPTEAERRQDNADLERLRRSAYTASCHAEQIQVTCIRTRSRFGAVACATADVDVCGRPRRYSYSFPEPGYPAKNDSSWVEKRTYLSELYRRGYELGNACRSDVDRDVGRDPVYHVTCVQTGTNWENEPDCTLGEIDACGKTTRWRLMLCARGATCWAGAQGVSGRDYWEQVGE